MSQFKKDVNEGLSATPKRLNSKYFYDEIGDKLFVDIMNMPEYYLTDAELEIFTKHTKELIGKLDFSKEKPVEIIELGAGDGTKTIQLLKELVKLDYPVKYIPVDISQHALDSLKKMLATNLPELSVETRQGDYFEVLSSLKFSSISKVVLFLGSNIGNLSDDRSNEFLIQLSDNINLDDKLLLGVDLIKSEEIVLPAYNDTAGITRAFNLNLLQRINKELGGDFQLDNFDHFPEYNEEEGIAKSALVSLVNQQVTIKELDKVFSFEKNEKIHTEISRKYNDEIIHKIIQKTPFQIETKILDDRKYFADYILKKY